MLAQLAGLLDTHGPVHCTTARDVHPFSQKLGFNDPKPCLLTLVSFHDSPLPFPTPISFPLSIHECTPQRYWPSSFSWVALPFLPKSGFQRPKQTHPCNSVCHSSPSPPSPHNMQTLLLDPTGALYPTVGFSTAQHCSYVETACPCSALAWSVRTVAPLSRCTTQTAHSMARPSAHLLCVAMDTHGTTPTGHSQWEALRQLEAPKCHHCVSGALNPKLLRNHWSETCSLDTKHHNMST